MLASNQSAYTSNMMARKTDYNALLIEGYNSFQNKQLTKALACYQQALDANPDATSKALVHSIIGVLHMHSCNYSEAINAFSEGLKYIDRTGNQRQTTVLGNYEQLSVLIKLQANLALCYLVIGQHKQALDRVNRCLSVIRMVHPSIKGDLFQTLMYIFFRFTSFSALRTADTDSPESKYDEVTQACFYSTMAVNKDLCSTPEEAYRLQRKALDIWTAKKQYGFMLISQRHLLHLAKELDRKKEAADYERQIQRTLECEQLQGISDKTLFKGYQEKMKTAKEIATLLAAFQNSERFTDPVQETPGWREATRLKLLQAVNMSRRMLADSSCKNRQEIERGVDQMLQTVRALEGQRNVLIQRNLQKSKFVVEAVNYLKAQSHRMIKTYERKQKANLQEGLANWRRWNDTLKQRQRQQRSRGPTSTNPRAQQQYELPPETSYPAGNTSVEFSSIESRNRLPIASNISTSRINNKTDPRNTSTMTPGAGQRVEQQPYVGNSGISQTSGIRTGNRTGRMEPEVPVISNPPSRIPNPHQSLSPIRNVERPASPAYTSRTNNEVSFIYAKDDPQTNRRITKYIRRCQAGQYLLKRHYTSDGGDEKFVKLTKIDIRWANDQERIMRPGKCQAYLLTDVKGIVYGKITDTMRKSCNKELYPWKCFSLILKKRTLDLYCPEEEDIDYWVPGMSGALARANPDKFMVGYSPGKMLWTKMFLILNYHFLEPRGKYEQQHEVPFAVALTRFIKNGMRLPHRKK